MKTPSIVGLVVIGLTVGSCLFIMRNRQDASLEQKPPDKQRPRISSDVGNTKAVMATGNSDVSNADSEKTSKQTAPPLESNIPREFIRSLSSDNCSVTATNIPPMNVAGQEELLKLFHEAKEQKTEERNNILRTLAWIGDDTVATEIIANVRLDYDWDTMVKQDVHYYNTLLDCIGLLARHNDVALNYLLQITEPSTPRQWTHAAFRSVCIALAESGRSEANARLSEISTNGVNIDNDSSIVDAMIYKSIVGQYGITNFFGQWSTDRIMAFYFNWKTTEEGKKWCEWKRQIDMKARPK